MSLSSIADWLNEVREIYPLLFFLGGMGIPLFHSDVLFFLLGAGKLSLFTLCACAISLSLGELVLCVVARKYGLKIYRHGPFSLFIKPSHLLRTRKLVKRHGPLIIVIARFIPGARSSTFVLLGCLRYQRSKIFFAALLSLALWAPLLYYCGRLLWLPLDSLQRVLSSILPIFLSMSFIVLITFIIYKRRKK